MTSTTTVSGHIEKLEEKSKNDNTWYEVQVGGQTPSDVYRGTGPVPEELEQGLKVELEIDDSDSFGDIQDYHLVYKENDEEGSEGPVDTVESGRVKCKVWENETGDGETYYSFDLHRVYTTDDGESFQKTSSFGKSDLPDLVTVVSYLSQHYNLETEASPSPGGDV